MQQINEQACRKDRERVQTPWRFSCAHCLAAAAHVASRPQHRACRRQRRQPGRSGNCARSALTAPEPAQGRPEHSVLDGQLPDRYRISIRAIGRRISHVGLSRPPQCVTMIGVTGILPSCPADVRPGGDRDFGAVLTRPVRSGPGTTCGNHRAHFPRHPRASPGMVLAGHAHDPALSAGPILRPFSPLQARWRWFEPTCAHQVFPARRPFWNTDRRLGNHGLEPPVHAPRRGSVPSGQGSIPWITRVRDVGLLDYVLDAPPQFGARRGRRSS
jgi:hypothetical protein